MIEYLSDMWALALEGELQGVWFWAAVYTFVVGVGSLSYQVRIRNWPAVQGNLSHAAVEKWGIPDIVASEQDYTAKAQYTYEVDGQSYEGRRVSPWVIVATTNLRALLAYQLKGIEASPDGAVKVLYNPRNPAKSFLIAPGWVGLCVTLLVALGPAIGYMMRF